MMQKVKPENRRCLYENDDVLIMHFLIPFPNGTKDAVLYYIQKEEGLMRRIETGSTPINWKTNYEQKAIDSSVQTEARKL